MEPRERYRWRPFAFKAVQEGFVVGVIDCTGMECRARVMTMIAGTMLSESLEEEGHEDPATVLILSIGS